MEGPKTAGEFLRQLTDRFNTEEPGELSKASGIPRPTIEHWAAHPDTKLKATSRAHYRRIFVAEGQLAEARNDMADVLDALGVIADMVRSIIQDRGMAWKPARRKQRPHGRGPAVDVRPIPADEERRAAGGRRPFGLRERREHH